MHSYGIGSGQAPAPMRFDQLPRSGSPPFLSPFSPECPTMSSYSSADDSYDSDEPPELELDLAKLMDCASKALKAKCTAVKKLTRGVGHEVFALQFQPEEVTDNTPPSFIRANFSCIARFSRLNNTRAKSASEIATARYLKRLSSIPVPEIYYYDLNPNDIGAPVVLMERMPGRHLNKI